MVGGNPSAGLEKVIVLLEETLMQQRSINLFMGDWGWIDDPLQ
jgi:hypothetical protein